MANAVFNEIFDAPFVFHTRPRPISCELRPVWRLHALVLIIDRCWGNQASFEQLHVMNWASRTQETRSTFLQFINGNRSPSDIIVRYDPSLNRAVHFAFAENIVGRRDIQSTLAGETKKHSSPYRVILTAKGTSMLQHLNSMEDCFVDLKRFLEAIPQKVSQKQIDMLFNWETSQ